MNRYFFKKQSGFTLLEVLVAGFILFLVISTMTMIYRGAILSSTKAERTLAITQALPYILDRIKSTLREDTSVEKMEIGHEGGLFSVEYRWQARVTEFKAPPSKFDTELTEFRTYPNRFKLWTVNLVVENGNYLKEYSFHEVSW